MLLSGKQNKNKPKKKKKKKKTFQIAESIQYQNAYNVE